MLRAIQQSQSTFHEFVRAVDEDRMRVVPALEEALVKYAFAATEGGAEVEHMFLSRIERSSESLSGVVTGEPLYTKAVKRGERVQIDPARVSDWLYVIDGKGIGGHTFKLIWSRFSEEEKSAYRSQPPFVWLNAP